MILGKIGTEEHRGLLDYVRTYVLRSILSSAALGENFMSWVAAAWYNQC